MALTQERLKQLLHYDPETGVFTRLLDSPNRRFKAGEVTGSVSNNGRYRQQWIDGRPFLEHRIAWLWMTGKFPDHQIDHVNLDKCNNRWANLREATISQNAMNRRGRAASGFKGVYFDKNEKKCGSKRWKASIAKGGRSIRLGHFHTPEEASAAYAAAALKFHGEFARVA